MTPVFFSVGFRPFFAAGSLFAGLALLLWGLFWLRATHPLLINMPQPVGGFLFWHAHEMLFGLAQAIILGFLFTAVRNWTGLETASPQTLMLLLTFWLQARMMILVGVSLDSNYIVVSQIITPLIGALCIGIPIIKKRMWRNLFAPIALVVFAPLDATAVLQIYQGHFPHQALQACLLLIIFIITIIGGRIIPLFTANKLGLKKAPEPTLLTALSSLPVLVLILLEFMPSDDKISHIQSALAFVLFIAHGIRLFRWHDAGIWKEPMLWSLFVFYSALPIGFLFRALDLHIDIASTHLHMLAVGTICGLIISMVSRVSLGHTGRKITHDSLIVGAFFLLISAFMLRTFGVMMFGSDAGLISSSALLASLSFLLIFVRLISVWLTPRADQ
jgi:uncharacterized protein involved in response to NO